MASISLNMHVEFALIDCGECGGSYAINERYRAQKAQSGGLWTCPYCKTGWGYPKDNENSRLKRWLAESEDRIQAALARANEAAAERDAAQTELSKTKKLHTAGVCPCCNRTVSQMARHMKTKHPEYQP